jgi:hypothetical protein
MEERTTDGRKIRILSIIDEYTRECLYIAVERRLNSQDVLMVFFISLSAGQSLITSDPTTVPSSQQKQ